MVVGLISPVFVGTSNGSSNDQTDNTTDTTEETGGTDVETQPTDESSTGAETGSGDGASSEGSGSLGVGSGSSSADSASNTSAQSVAVQAALASSQPDTETAAREEISLSADSAEQLARAFAERTLAETRQMMVVDALTVTLTAANSTNAPDGSAASAPAEYEGTIVSLDRKV